MLGVSARRSAAGGPQRYTPSAHRASRCRIARRGWAVPAPRACIPARREANGGRGCGGIAPPTPCDGAKPHCRFKNSSIDDYRRGGAGMIALRTPAGVCPGVSGISLGSSVRAATPAHYDAERAETMTRAARPASRSARMSSYGGNRGYACEIFAWERV